MIDIVLVIAYCIVLGVFASLLFLPMRLTKTRKAPEAPYKIEPPTDPVPVEVPLEPVVTTTEKPKKPRKPRKPKIVV